MMDQEALRKLIEQAIREVVASQGAPAAPAAAAAPATSSIAGTGDMTLTETGDAQRGTDPTEVVIGLSPAFSTTIFETIIGLKHSDVLRQICAGIEEEGLKFRFIRVYKTADVGFIAHEAAKMSGSGIGIGIQSRGTTVIHQRDLPPLSNLELFSQAPLIELETFRAIGRNAGRYAKGLNPDPVPVRNDQMARPKYQAVAALLHNKETRLTEKSKKPQAIQVSFK